MIRQRALMAGMNDHLGKAFQIIDLDDRLYLAVCRQKDGGRRYSWFAVKAYRRGDSHSYETWRYSILYWTVWWQCSISLKSVVDGFEASPEFT